MTRLKTRSLLPAWLALCTPAAYAELPTAASAMRIFGPSATLTVNTLSDAADRRLFQDHPPRH